ncbi:hypothetical protein L2E82_19496 [Cichorium intybus]|uniref:Uncharacterized protein n=1 Tax=Cichorium intybus TaxID=13427 RepID=A0ACB9FCD6_CICIN|nr:hypothetical protein L2E82_19496 [Cichorium intybus]
MVLAVFCSSGGSLELFFKVLDGFAPSRLRSSLNIKSLLQRYTLCSFMDDSTPGSAAAKFVGLFYLWRFLASFILDVKGYFGDFSGVGASNPDFAAVFWAGWLFLGGSCHSTLWTDLPLEFLFLKIAAAVIFGSVDAFAPGIF